MNKKAILEWICAEIEKENLKCDRAKSTKIQDNHLAIIVGLDRVKEYIKLEIEKTCTYDLWDEESNTYKCSNCEELWTLNSDSPKENNMNYCPNCGLRIKH